MKIFDNYSLKNLNTFQLNYKCKTFIEVESCDEIYEINKIFNLSNTKFLVIGEGSNILFTKDFDGVVLHPKFDNISFKYEDDQTISLEVEAGKNWDKLVRFTVNKNLGGIENLILIPGLTGATPIQNIGAYGQEVKDVIESVHFFDFEDNLFKVLFNNQCRFEYRNSIFKQELKNRVFITSIQLKLNKNPIPKIDYGNLRDELNKLGIVSPSIQDVSRLIEKIRSEKLPSPKEFGNAGSFFKNPIVGKTKFETIKKHYSDIQFFNFSDNHIKIPAAWLIEKIGYKGKVKGNVATYQKQPLVLINLGNATGIEILSFANEIKEKVLNAFDIELETEVNIV